MLLQRRMSAGTLAREQSRESRLYRESTVEAAAAVCSLPRCGGGVGRGVTTNSVLVATPLPVPPPQGGRERCGASLRNVNIALAERTLAERCAVAHADHRRACVAPSRASHLPGMSQEPAIAVDQLVKVYTSGGRTTRAVDGISFALEPGSITGLLGGNGA